MRNFILKGHICSSDSLDNLCIYENAYVVCKEGKTEGIFPKLSEAFADFPVYDYGDRIIIPGLIDLHIHAPQYSFRGMCMDLELMDWLEQHTFPEESKYEDLKYARRSYEIFAQQMKKSATTRACIFATQHRPATELLMELMEDTGLVSYVGKVNMDREAPDSLRENSAETSAFTTFGWINNTINRFEHTKPILTPRFIPCCTDKLMEELREIQMAYGIPVQSHLSENQGEMEVVRGFRPQDAFYGEAYDDFDLFGINEDNNTEVKTVMAHCVWSTRQEVELMRKNGVFVAHCPASNMNLSSGIAPIRKYLDMGMRVGLGSDVAGGQTESIFRAMTDAIQVSKMYWRYVDDTAKPITFSEAFYMATKGGGAFFEKTGGFEKGYSFDAVVLDDSSLPHPQELTVRQRLERAVYLELDRQGIYAKYVDGKRIIG